MITQGEVLDIASQAIYTIIVVSAPLLLVSLIIGLIISIFQTVTSIQEQTLTFVPKILAVFVGNDDFWFMDTDTANRVYYRFVVEFRRILKLSGYGKFEFFFSYI